VSAPDSQVRIAILERELHWAQLKIQVLEERLRKQRILMLGPQSETLSNLQLDYWPTKSLVSLPKRYKPKHVVSRW